MRTLYRTAASESTTWPEPFESAYQAQRRRHGPAVPGARRPDITLSLRLLIASVVSLGQDRPFGLITALAEVLGLSRQSIYDIGHAWSSPWAPGGSWPACEAATPADPSAIARAALTLLVVGAMQLRATQWCLEALLGQRRSIGWLSGLVDEAGTRAGAVLAAADWSGAERLIVSRDELFMGDLAWLLTTDTASHAVLSAHVETDVDAETWALSLALDAHKTGGRIDAVAEDGATYFPLSIHLAQKLLDQPFQPEVRKDHWHLQRQAGRTLRDADRIAIRYMETAERKASQFRPGLMIIRDRDDWEAAHARAERAIATADTIRAVVGLLGEVLGLVDRRTGRIVDRATAEWYLATMVADLRHTGSDLAEALAGTVQRQTPSLLAFHDRLAVTLNAWRQEAAIHYTDPQIAEILERAVAQAWRLDRALTNGRRHCQLAARRAAAHVQALCQADPMAERLADGLHSLLDGTVRTSAASENINSILRAYLWGRRYFRDRRTAQNWLNLLVLWHNLHVFERGKRAGHSPFQLAGVTVRAPDGQPTDDWLTALGYAAAA